MIHISTFSGIGGFEIAAEFMGWRNLVSCDINQFGNKLREFYWPESYHHTDIKTLKYETINNELTKRYGPNWRNAPIVFTGGFPCQPFSVAGKQLGTEDDRHLWPEMLRVIREVTPEWIVGENVRGLVNWSGGLVFEQVQADLETEGYEVLQFILPACAVDAPHRRDRVWFVAHSNGTRLQTEGAEQSATGTTGGGVQGIATDTESDKNDRNRQARFFAKSPRFDEQGPTTDTTSQGREKWEQHNGREIPKETEGGANDRPERPGEKWVVIDPMHNGLQGRQFNGSVGENGEAKREGRFSVRSVRSQWEIFPTQSPVCGGDDGISDRLDGITFSKWRQESIKAYGNAVVPPLVFEIFKAIEAYENL